MTQSPAAPPSNPAGFPFLFGPMAIACGRGASARRCAQLVHEESVRRGFHGKSLTTEETARLPLDRYSSMVVIAPSEGLDEGRDTAALIRSSSDLVGGYRARRPDGLAALRAGLADTDDIGVLQLVADQCLLDDPMARSMLDKACVVHELRVPSRDPRVIFEALQADIPGLASLGPGLLSNLQMRQLWNQVRQWGLHDISEVEIVFTRINELRDHFNHDVREGLRRPLGEAVPRSRYDFVLDEPHTPARPGNFRNWTPDGAAVVRMAIPMIAERVPTFKNPRPHRDSTKRFQTFYDDLRCLRLYLKLTPQTEQIDFSNE